MNLSDTKFGGVYKHLPTGKIVTLIACYYDDGATLIVEARDQHGDILSGEIFRTEAYLLSPCTCEAWESVYPPSNEENFSYDEMVGGAS